MVSNHVQIIAALKDVLGGGAFSLHEPTFAGNELVYLQECLESTYVSSVGPFVDRFERELAKFTGAKYAIAVVNGTAALHISLMLAGVEADDEVLVPALTFVATANAISYCGATPHFVETDCTTLGMDISKLRAYLNDSTNQIAGNCINRKTGRVIRAVVPMHTFGHSVDLDGLLAVCRDFNLTLVEDAAESLGSYYHGKHLGTFGLLGALSFNGNKIITTGGGGAILTNSSQLAIRAKHLTTTAKLSHPWKFTHDEIGFNYRLPNINAALGCAQLEMLPKFLTSKRALFEKYKTAFQGINGVRLISEQDQCRSNYWLQTLLLETGQLNVALNEINAAGYSVRPIWTPLHLLKPFEGCPRMDLSVAEEMAEKLLNLPSSSFL